MRRALAVILVAIAAAALAPTARGQAVGEVAAVLSRQTQELLDAVTAGDPKVWDRYLASDMSYSDESGIVRTKAGLLGEIRPLPKGVSGQLKVVDFAARVYGDAAVTTYVVDESETYFGQEIGARYRATDTWHRTADGWRLVAAHVVALRNDPPAVALPAARLDEYVGVYALTPEISYTIRRDGDRLAAQRTGRKEERLEAEVADMFFVRGDPRMRKVFQRGADGRITGFVERRESWDVLWKRQR